MNTTLTPADILAEAEALSAAPKQKKDSQFILESLLHQVKRIDYLAEVYPQYPGLMAEREKLIKETTAPDGSIIDDEIKLKQLKENTAKIEALKIFHKHYLIVTIEKLLKVAEQNQWSLCQRYGFYYVYNGEFWNVISEDDLKTFLGKVAEKMGVPRFDSRHYEFKDKLFKQFDATAHLPEPNIPDDLILINLENGTFEITPDGHRLREFRAADFLTYQLSFSYDPTAIAPLFHSYLNHVLPDGESRLVLGEYGGYVFTRNMNLEKALFLYGSGRNGKSVFFNVFKALIGDENISHYSLHSLTDDKGYHRAMLVNKLINWASDIGDRLQSEMFKQLASGEPTEARLPHKDPFILKNVCKFAFNTNKLPVDVEHTSAFFERFLIVPFDVYIPPENRDPALAGKIIQSELPGVFNWVLDGLNRLVQNGGFSQCRASDRVLAEYRKDSDSVALFIDDKGYHRSEGWIHAKPVYDDYREYCFAEGLKPLSRKNFHKRLELLGFITGTQNIGKVLYITRNGQN